jgi:hypothetical protein
MKQYNIDDLKQPAVENVAEADMAVLAYGEKDKSSVLKSREDVSRPGLFYTGEGLLSRFAHEKPRLIAWLSLSDVRGGNPRTKEVFERVFDVLVKHAGASETMREQFMPKMLEWTAREAYGVWEFRFMGGLGMGGKFWLTPDSFYVTAYPDDITEKNGRQTVINTTNAELKKLFVPPEADHET